QAEEPQHRQQQEVVDWLRSLSEIHAASHPLGVCLNRIKTHVIGAETDVVRPTRVRAFGASLDGKAAQNMSGYLHGGTARGAKDELLGNCCWCRHHAADV